MNAVVPGWNQDPCPCGRPAPFTSCCGRYIGHFADTPAPDAESLMCSRYSAYVQLEADYLFATWHPAHRPARLDLDRSTKWLGLQLRSHKAIDANHAEVEFVARSRSLGGKAVRLHERSRFVRENGRWFYLDGDMV